MNRIYHSLTSPTGRRLGQWGLRAIGPIVLVVLLVILMLVTYVPAIPMALVYLFYR